MNKIVSRGLWFTVILGGLSLAGIGAANAATTNGDNGAASGEQASPSITLPVTLGGNAISVLGGSTASAPSAAAPAPAAAAPAPSPAPAGDATSGQNSVGSGTQVPVSGTVPVDVGGNAVSVLGQSSATDGSAGSGTTDASATPVPTPVPPLTTSGEEALLSGSQFPIRVQAPVTADSNGVSVLGTSSSSDPAAEPSTDSTGTAATDSGAGDATSGTNGAASGEQIPVGITAPVTANGDAIGVLGDSATTSNGNGTSTGNTGTGTGGTGTGANGTGNTTSGTNGVGSGEQIPVEVAVPATVGGNAISVLGSSTTSGAGSTGTPTGPTGPTSPTDPNGPTGGSGSVVASAGLASSDHSTLASAALSSSILADTGSNLEGLIGGAALLLVLGMALAAVANRRSRKS